MWKNNTEVYIRCEGRTLPEYQVEAVDEKTMACYIPSEAGKTFAIYWRGGPRVQDEHITTVRPCIDGHMFGGKHYNPGRYIVGSHAGVQTSRDQERPFTFAPLATTDEDDDAPEIKPFPDPGTIEVHFTHVVERGREPRKFNHFDCDAARTVHERTKKLGAHCVSFDGPRACPPRDVTVLSKLAHKNEPYYMRFIFRYRPKDLLRAQGIIDAPPRAPAPTAGPRATNASARGQKRRADQSEAGAQPEAGPSRKRAKTAAAAAAAGRPRVKEEDEDEDALEAELKAIQARSRAIQAKLSAKARTGAGANANADPPPVKREESVDPVISVRRIKKEREEGVDPVVIERQNKEREEMLAAYGARRIKRERSPVRLRIAVRGEVYDLTLD